MALVIVPQGEGACKIAYCRVCLDTFKVYKGRGRRRKRCVTCQQAGARTKPTVYKGRKRSSRVFDCRICGKAFHPFDTSKNKYCSHSCAFEGQRIDRGIAKAKRLEAKPGPYSKIFLCSCRVCTKVFYSKHLRSALCSDACSKADANRRAVEYGASQKGVKQHNCKECGALFLSRYGDKRRVFCSDKCANKASRRVSNPKRKAKLRAAFVEKVDPFMVFDRDKWRCRMCQQPTPKTLRGTTHDNAPELDHIKPLSRGGEHSYRNTQCLCRKCNSRKSDKFWIVSSGWMVEDTTHGGRYKFPSLD